MVGRAPGPERLIFKGGEVAAVLHRAREDSNLRPTDCELTAAALGGATHELVAALGEIDCETTLVPTRHPVVDIVR